MAGDAPLSVVWQAVAYSSQVRSGIRCTAADRERSRRLCNGQQRSVSYQLFKCIELQPLTGCLQVAKLEKVREFEWSGKGQGKIFFFVKVRENEKFVPPDVRFSG